MNRRERPMSGALSGWWRVACVATVVVGGCPRGDSGDAATSDAFDDPSADIACIERGDGVSVPTFHYDRQRSGWNSRESVLTPERVRSAAFRERWSSPVLDSVTIDGVVHPPHLFATPLVLDRVTLRSGPAAGRTLALVFAATSTGWAYAIAAEERECSGTRIRPGAIVWRTRLGTPVRVDFDGGIPLGVLSTPTIDDRASPPGLYVASLDARAGWRVHALDVTTGDEVPGWPVNLDASVMMARNANGPASFGPAEVMSQRTSLNLSPAGDRLYLGFAAFPWTQTGWVVAVDTRAPSVLRTHSSAPAGSANGRGGVWGSGGLPITEDGTVFATTGNGLERSGPLPGVWANSLLRFDPDLARTGSYTPFNYCMLDDQDMDLAASAPIVVDLAPGETRTPRLVAFGGKQGTVYLVDRDALSRGADRRPACGAASGSDLSLLPPDPQPQFGARGPLQVFGPYTESHAMLDFARMHTQLAFMRDGNDRPILFATGASKRSEDDSTSVPPCVARLRIVTDPARPAYLAIDGLNRETTLVNPGSPVVSSLDGTNAIVWVLDSNQPRTAHLSGPSAAHAVLYAFDAVSLERLWRSADGQLGVGGKYNSPTVANGMVLVGTDRIQAFGWAGP